VQAGARRGERSPHLKFDIHTPAKGRRDVHKRIEREAGDSAAQQVVDARLRHAAMAGGLALAYVAGKAVDIVTQSIAFAVAGAVMGFFV
jgi:hypothetical protein